MIGTKSYFTNSSKHIQRSMAMWTDLGYSLDIPWGTVTTFGWQESNVGHIDGPMWGTERDLTTRSDPEYWAEGDIIRSNVLPEINPHDPIYSFERSKYTHKI